MRSLLTVATAVVILLVTALPSTAQPDPARPQPGGVDVGADVVPGRFVLVGGDGSDLLDGLDARAPSVDVAGRPVVIDGAADRDPHMEAQRLGDRLGATVLPMVRYRMLADPALEPAFGDQWALENTGQTGGTAGADIAARSAWRWNRGAGAVVAVIDSGLELGNPELDERLWVNGREIDGNGVDDDANSLVDDVHGWDFIDGDPVADDVVGHGTAVAGLIAGAANGVGITGVAPDAELLVVKACDAAGCPADAVAAGIVYAADAGADVVNLSLGAQGYDPLVEAAIRYAGDRGTLVVAAAGNSGVDVDQGVPWTPVGVDDDALVGVAWSDDNDRLAAASNFGLTSVDLTAPGSGILAPVLGGYTYLDGSSFSAPHVAGVAALMRSVDPGMPAEEMQRMLVTASDPIADLLPATSGGGRLDAAEAVYGARFRDIPRTTFADDIMWAATGGITKGCDPPANRHYCPAETVTRGQMAAFLVRALGLASAPDGDAFTDDDDSVFEDDIERLAAAGITRGCTPTRFCPNDPVTRGQMAAFLVRGFGVAAAPGGFDTFADDDGSTFESEIELLAGAGITKGCTPTRFCPNDPVTRGQMAAFLRRS